MLENQGLQGANKLGEQASGGESGRFTFRRLSENSKAWGLEIEVDGETEVLVFTPKFWKDETLEKTLEDLKNEIRIERKMECESMKFDTVAEYMDYVRRNGEPQGPTSIRNAIRVHVRPRPENIAPEQ